MCQPDARRFPSGTGVSNTIAAHCNFNKRTINKVSLLSLSPQHPVAVAALIPSHWSISRAAVLLDLVALLDVPSSSSFELVLFPVG
jgi:hypothetical protein